MTVVYIWYRGNDGKKRYLQDEGRLGAPMWTDDLQRAKGMNPESARGIVGGLPREPEMVGSFEISPD
jgi:hypothetical protein